MTIRITISFLQLQLLNELMKSVFSTIITCHHTREEKASIYLRQDIYKTISNKFISQAASMKKRNNIKLTLKYYVAVEIRSLLLLVCDEISSRETSVINRKNAMLIDLIAQLDQKTI